MADDKKVLIVDDDAQLLRLFSTKLDHEGFEVVTARNGEEGFEKAKEESPDIILLDLRMPKMNGIETLTALEGEEATADTPVLILSSWNKWSSMKMSGDTARSLGAEDFIEKDIELDKLVEKVRWKLEQALQE